LSGPKQLWMAPFPRFPIRARASVIPVRHRDTQGVIPNNSAWPRSPRSPIA
jgi:hypothetical protein